MKKLTSALLLSLISAAAFNAGAADTVTINVTGKVVASPCTTINSGNPTLDVNLGDAIQANTLADAGSGTPLIKFDLPLEHCPVGTSNVKATFSGTADTSPELWKNGAAKPAANTAVELSEQDTGTIVSNGSTLNAGVSDGNATFKLQARAVSSAGSAGPGDISSTIVVAFEYQ